MKLSTFISSVAVVSLVTGMPVVSMAHENDVKAEHTVSVNAEDSQGGFRGWSAGLLHLDKIGAKANLGVSLETRISKIIAKFDANKDRHIAAYNRLKTRLNNLVTKLDAKGYDTAQLKADLLVLDTKVAQFGVDYSAYIDALRVADTDAKNGDDVAAKAQLVVAKGLLATAKASGQAVRTYYFQTIRVDIRTLKQA